MKTSANGIGLIKLSEDCKLTAYLDSSKIPTIGYGHTGSVNGKPIVAGVTKITQQQANDLLANDLVQFENGINKTVTVKLNQNQFDALVSFSYNNGLGGLQNLVKSSGLNQGLYQDVPQHMIKYDKAIVNGELVEIQGLRNRRIREISLWNKPC